MMSISCFIKCVLIYKKMNNLKSRKFEDYFMRNHYMVLRSCFKLSKGGYNYVIHWNIMRMHWILFTLLKGELYGTYNISGRRRTRDS